MESSSGAIPPPAFSVRKIKSLTHQGDLYEVWELSKLHIELPGNCKAHAGRPLEEDIQLFHAFLCRGSGDWLVLTESGGIRVAEPRGARAALGSRQTRRTAPRR